jgi:hypothetical protein
VNSIVLMGYLARVHLKTLMSLLSLVLKVHEMT